MYLLSGFRINDNILGKKSCRAKDLLGPCYKLDPDIRSVFMRIMILFGLHRTRGEDDDAFGGQQQV